LRFQGLAGRQPQLPSKTVEKSGIPGIFAACRLTGGNRSKKSEKPLTVGMAFAIVAAHTVNLEQQQTHNENKNTTSRRCRRARSRDFIFTSAGLFG
jgi:hypothetical protein